MNGSEPPPRLCHHGLFRDLDRNDPNLALRKCEGIDVTGPYSIKKTNEEIWNHFVDDDLLDHHGGGTFITFILVKISMNTIYLCDEVINEFNNYEVE
jgi:hypothetical protein